MHTAILYIAERCNQNCVFCLEEDGKWAEFIDPSTQQVFDVLARLFARGARQITFMGGETFFRKDLPRVLQHAKSLGYRRIGVTTNGTVLSKPGFVTDLVRAGLDFIEFSLHGHTEELANAIAQSNITFERQAKALAELDSLGNLLTILNVVVCKENREHLRDIAAYVCEKFPNLPVRFKFKFVSLQGLAQRTSALAYEDVDFVAVGDYLAARDADFWFYNVPLCRLGAHAHRSHELSTLSADERYFDFDHSGNSDYFETGHQLEGRVWPKSSCGACSFKPVCPGLEETYRRVHGDGSLSARSDDPLPAIDFALNDRKLDPAQASQRLEALKLEPRPEHFILPRPEGALRFRHGTRTLDVTVAPLTEGARGFVVTSKFVLSYRANDEGQQRDAATMGLLNRAAQLLRAADTGTVEEARKAITAAATEGWTLDAGWVAGTVKRKKLTFKLPELNVPT